MGDREIHEAFVHKDGEWSKLSDDNSSDMMNMLNGLVQPTQPHPFTPERRRREELNRCYMLLRKQISNATKGDRASIVGDAIEYIKALLTEVGELKECVQKKRKREEITQGDQVPAEIQK
ncbi:hypothetical protein ACHQM5_016067 [Ranunculus cassubicifolius]